MADLKVVTQQVAELRANLKLEHAKLVTKFLGDVEDIVNESGGVPYNLELALSGNQLRLTANFDGLKTISEIRVMLDLC